VGTARELLTLNSCCHLHGFSMYTVPVYMSISGTWFSADVEPAEEEMVDSQSLPCLLYTHYYKKCLTCHFRSSQQSMSHPICRVSGMFGHYCWPATEDVQWVKWELRYILHIVVMDARKDYNAHTSTCTMCVKLSFPTDFDTNVMNLVPSSKNLGPPVTCWIVNWLSDCRYIIMIFVFI